MNYRITHTELWPHKKTEHDAITLPKDAMLAYLGGLLWSAQGVEIEFDHFRFTHNFTRADGDLDTMENSVWVKPIRDGSKS